MEALVEANAPELLVQRLLGFKEADSDEEARAVHNCLAVVENMVEVGAGVGGCAGSWGAGHQLGMGQAWPGTDSGATQVC